MLLTNIKSLLTVEQKIRIKKLIHKFKYRYFNWLYKYDYNKLKVALKNIGLNDGDTILVHSSLNPNSGFSGKPQDIIKCILDIIGENGNLLMVSMPYTSSTYDYLSDSTLFDVNKTPSKMGIISEIFRRKSGVKRSSNPAHPILTYGKDAEWIIKNHEDCLYSCGENTPLDKFKKLNGKVLFFDTPFNSFTFIHYIEHMIKEYLPFKLYRDEPVEIRVIDANNCTTHKKYYVFSEQTVKRRQPDILEKYVIEKNHLKKIKVGNTNIMLIDTSDVINDVKEMLKNNIIFYAS